MIEWLKVVLGTAMVLLTMSVVIHAFAEDQKYISLAKWMERLALIITITVLSEVI